MSNGECDCHVDPREPFMSKLVLGSFLLFSPPLLRQSLFPYRKWVSWPIPLLIYFAEPSISLSEPGSQCPSVHCAQLALSSMVPKLHGVALGAPA